MWLSVCEALKRFLSLIFLGAGRKALFLAISMWRFLLLKDSSSPGERIPPSRRRVGRILFFPAPGLAPGAGVSLPVPAAALLPAPAEAFLLSQCGVEAFFSCWQKDQQPRRHTVCLLLSSGRQSLHSLLTAPGWRGARFDSTMTPGYSKFKAQISFSVERCISAMRRRIIKEQQRCWLLLAFRFRAYTSPYRFLRGLLLCRQQTDAYPAILKMYVCTLFNIPSQSHLHQDGDEINSGHCAPIFSANFHFWKRTKSPRTAPMAWLHPLPRSKG